MRIQLTILLALLCFQFNAYSMYDCDCSWDIDLVCIQADDGNIIPFPNACWAACMGFTEDDFIDCDYDASFDPTCGCSFDITPVCVESTSGDIVLFPNSCLAECGGYAASDFLDCNYDLPTDPNCGCSYDLDEVCFVIAEGIYMPFLNPCWANCLGYAEDTYMNCGAIFQDEEAVTLVIDQLINMVEEGGGNTSNFSSTIPEYYQVIETEDIDVINRVVIFPNPIGKEQLNLKMDVETDANVRIDLMSIAGKLYKSINHMVVKGQEVLEIEVNDLPAGVYYINIYSGKHSTTMKFVKQ